MLATATIPTTPSHLGGDWRKDSSDLSQSCDWIKCWLRRYFSFSAPRSGDGRRRVCYVHSHVRGRSRYGRERFWLQAVSLGIFLIVSTCPGIFRECYVLVLGEERAKIDWGSLKQTKTHMHVTCHHSSLQLLET